jgi:hypothetical protein
MSKNKGLCGPRYIMPDSKETLKETTKLPSNQGRKRQSLIKKKRNGKTDDDSNCYVQVVFASAM